MCAAPAAPHFHTDRRRSYRRCESCFLVFVPAIFHLDIAQERAEYDKHQNTVQDPGYRQFLSRLALPLLNYLSPASQGLDFGCGPGPALARLLEEGGHRVAVYDPYYAPDAELLQRSYDFICATEVVEHLHQPGRELARLWSLLRPGGCLGVMTKLVIDREAFGRWHYKNDPTHVCFFSRETWQWWAGKYAASIRFIGSDVILLTKPV